MNVITIMKALCAVGLVFIVVLQVKATKEIMATEEGREKMAKEKKHAVYNWIVSFVMNFFDVFGIGSYATSTAAYKLRRSVDDADLPGTLNVGDCVPVLLEAIMFFGLVEIDLLTLVSLLVAMIVGARLGAGVVSKWKLSTLRLSIGIAMICVGCVMICKQLGVGPFGLVGMETGIYGFKLVIAIIIEFFLGALMNIGFGAYAPTLALVSILGMNVQSAFPIMMGGCAFLMTFGNGPKFLKEHRFDVYATWGNSIAGAAGALVAYFLVKSMSVKVLLWIVTVVVFFTAASFLRDYAKEKNA